MKKIFLLIILLINVTALNADECTLPSRNYNYMKLGGLLTPGNPTNAGAAIGVGRRFEENGHAFDISLNYGGTANSQTWATPKLMYLVIQDPLAARSLYWGGGLSWGGLHNKDKSKKFDGLMGEFAIGMDLERHCNIRPFVELTLSQPLIATNSKHNTILPPAITLAYGFGF